MATKKTKTASKLKPTLQQETHFMSDLIAVSTRLRQLEEDVHTLATSVLSLTRLLAKNEATEPCCSEATDPRQPWNTPQQ